MNFEDLLNSGKDKEFKKLTEEAPKNQYYNYSNPDSDTNLDDLANGVSKLDISYGNNIDHQTSGNNNYKDELEETKYETISGYKEYPFGKGPTGESDSGRIMSDQVYVDPAGKVLAPFFEYLEIEEDDEEEDKDEAKEGGWRSGKKGHQPYMKSIEYGGNYKECYNCEVNILEENGKCPICKSEL